MIEFDRDGEPQRIPQSWADHGRRDRAGPGQRRAYAIRAVPGWREYQSEYYVPGNGTYPDHSSVDPQLEVLYVTPDLLEAVERRVDASRSDGSVRPTDGFAAVPAVDHDALADVKSFRARWAYRRDLTALYGVDAIEAPRQSNPTEFSSAIELRADGGHDE